MHPFSTPWISPPPQTLRVEKRCIGNKWVNGIGFLLKYTFLPLVLHDVYLSYISELKRNLREKQAAINTVWKLFVFGVFLVRIFPLLIEYRDLQRVNTEKYRPKNSEYRHFVHSLGYSVIYVFNTFFAKVVFLYPLNFQKKTWFSDISRGCWKRRLT